MQQRSIKTTSGGDMKNPGLIRFIFNDPRTAPVWAVIRILVGLQWLSIAIPKLNNPGWMEGGEIVRFWWTQQTAIPESGPPPIIYGWYRDFLSGMLNAGAYEWMAPLIVYAEILFGVLFITGAFVGFTGLAAAFLHWNYLLAGSAGNNGLMFPATILLIVAWKVAGYYGLDYFLMRRVSALWSPRREADDGTNATPQALPQGAGD